MPFSCSTPDTIKMVDCCLKTLPMLLQLVSFSSTI
uniref:Uncharacterized protein n=1 Tax=Arundo donax TaxID=35708 RepID=A0A0A9FL47_ARUDO